MNIRAKELWKVPVFCIVAGILYWYIYVYLVAWVGVQTLPDGSIGANPVVTWLADAVLFAATLLTGWRIFRKLSKKELFWSATILVVPLLVLVVIQLIVGTRLGFISQLSLFYTEIVTWGQFITQLLFLLTKSSAFCAIATAFHPYIFILFGHKQAE